MKPSTIIFTTLISASNNYAAAYINPFRGIQQYLYQTSDEIISFSDESASASIDCIRPINKLRSMDIVQACDELGQGQLPYECDEGAGLCCTITTQSEVLSDEEDSMELPFKDVTISGFGTCHRIEDEELGEGQCDPTASEDELNDQCNCHGGYADCYEGDCDAPEGMGCCSCAMPGRPYVDSSGKTLLASINTVVNVEGEVNMLEEDTSQSIADNNCTSTTAYHLGQQWASNALGEHASVASFSAFSIALMSNGAPSDLVEDALTAGLDELRHAKTSFDIATKLLRKDIVPGPLPVSKHEFDQDIKKLALSVAKEGCVDESLSALELEAEVELLSEELDGDVERSNTKYAGIDHETLTWIRDELRIIASEESSHAALAWRTFDWVCGIDADACNAVKEQVLNKDELEKAFQRRFGSFAGTAKTLDMMKDSWAKLSMQI